MAVKIRLKRMGKVRAPHYRIVVVDSRKKRDGKVIEEIGLYHPKEDPSYIRVVSDRAQYWLGVGAQPSEAVAQLLKITGDWQKFKGYKNTEGTLRVAEPKRDKLEIFNEALKDAANEPKGEAVTRRATKKSAAKTIEADDKSQGKSEDKVEAKTETKAAAKPEEKAEAEVEAEAKSEAKVEAKVEAKPEAKTEETVEAKPDETVEEKVEETAPVPADETPEGATEAAETAETAEVDAEAQQKSED